MNKSPFFIIAALLLASYMLVENYSSESLSDEPVKLTQADPPRIVMFGTRSCKYCALTRAFFRKHNLPYVEHDIETSDKYMQKFILLGGRGTPLVIINGNIIYGFDENLMRSSL